MTGDPFVFLVIVSVVLLFWAWVIFATMRRTPERDDFAISQPAEQPPAEPATGTGQTAKSSSGLTTRSPDAAGADLPVQSSRNAVAAPQPNLSSRTTKRDGLFICYRREDTADAAGRLHDRLTPQFGRDRVFMDIDSVPLGVNFVTHINQQLQ